ncbi:hypothetical protein GEMRC1_007537 [Eukaryota sp. GEM-RC1]
MATLTVAFLIIVLSLSCTATDFSVSFFTEHSVDDVYSHTEFILSIYPKSSDSFFQVCWGDDSASKCSSETTYTHNYLNSGTFTITIYSSNDQSSCRLNLDQSLGSFKTRTITVLDSFSCYDFTLLQDGSTTPPFLNLSSESSLFELKVFSESTDLSSVYAHLGESLQVTSSLNIVTSISPYNASTNSWWLSIDPIPYPTMNHFTNDQRLNANIPRVIDLIRYFSITVSSTGIKYHKCVVRDLLIEGLIDDDYVDYDFDFLGDVVDSEQSFGTKLETICSDCNPLVCLSYFVDDDSSSKFHVFPTFSGYRGQKSPVIDISRSKSVLTGQNSDVIDDVTSLCNTFTQQQCKNMKIFKYSIMNGLNRFFINTNYGPIVASRSNVTRSKINFNPIKDLSDERIQEGLVFSFSEYHVVNGFGCSPSGFVDFQRYTFYTSYNNPESGDVLSYTTSDLFSDWSVMSIPFGIRVGPFDTSARIVIDVLRIPTIGYTLIVLGDQYHQKVDIVYNFDDFREGEPDYEFRPSSKSQFDPSSGWFTSVFQFPQSEVIDWIKVDKKGSVIYAVGQSLWVAVINSDSLLFSKVVAFQGNESVVDFELCGSYFLIRTNQLRLYYGNIGGEHASSIDVPPFISILVVI